MRTITVSYNALRQVLVALTGPDHLIRELQYTRNPLLGSNPINTLIEEMNAAPVPTQPKDAA